jgi:acyl carrier protein
MNGLAKTSSATTAEIVSELRAQLAELSDGKLTAEAIDPSAHIFDYGYADSLSAVTLLAQIEDRWGVRIDDVDLVEKYSTLEAIAEHVAGQG